MENSQVADALKYNHYINNHRFHIKLLSPGARHILHRQSFNFAIELIVKIIDISLTKLYGMRLQFRYVVEDFFFRNVSTLKGCIADVLGPSGFVDTLRNAGLFTRRYSRGLNIENEIASKISFTEYNWDVFLI